MFINLVLSTVVSVEYDYRTKSYTNEKHIKLPKDIAVKGNTFIFIIGKDQEGRFRALKTHPQLRIIHVSKPAVNKVPGHGTDPRNTVVVAEYNEPVKV
jgi:hypothetical protein